MRVGTRLMLVGAALPALALLAAFAASEALLRAVLLARLDEALLQQAAVESVSLFDGPDGLPHLHVAASQLAEAVRPFAPVGALYGPDGTLVLHAPPDAPVPLREAPLQQRARPALVTVDGGRELLVTVRAPTQQLYTLRLLGSLAPVEAAVRAFRTVALAVGGPLVVLVCALQLWQARSLHRRLQALTAALPYLRDGTLASLLPRDGQRDELEDLRAALVDAGERLRAAREAQQRLVANAAHELRTPLGLMRTGIDLALRRERSPDELKAALREVGDEVDRLTALAKNLLDLAAVGRVGFHPQPGDLAGAVARCSAAFQAEAEVRGVRLTVQAPRAAWARFDEPSLRQAVGNLLANALRFAPRGSDVALRLEHGVAGGAAGWVLRVTDQGPGVPAGEEEKIFEPFHRAPGASPGAGLGLAIVREIALRHGGHAWLERGGAAGTTFALALPVA